MLSSACKVKLYLWEEKYVNMCISIIAWYYLHNNNILEMEIKINSTSLAAAVSNPFFYLNLSQVLKTWTEVFAEDFPEEFSSSFSSRFFYKIFPQDFSSRFFLRIFPKIFPEDNSWSFFPEYISWSFFWRFFLKIILED